MSGRILKRIRTKNGKPVTKVDLARMAKAAEAGFDLSTWRAKPGLRYMALDPKSGLAHIARVGPLASLDIDEHGGSPISASVHARLLCTGASATGYLLSDGMFIDDFCELCQKVTAR